MKKVNSKKNVKQRIETKRKGLLILGGVIVLAAMAIYGPQIQNKSYQEVIDYTILDGGTIPENMVCMVRGDIKNKASLPLHIGDKTYYGCCKKCLLKLEENVGNIRFTIDPITGESISKADAVIKQDPQRPERVMFFKSNETYSQYLKRNVKGKGY